MNKHESGQAHVPADEMSSKGYSNAINSRSLPKTGSASKMVNNHYSDCNRDHNGDADIDYEDEEDADFEPYDAAIGGDATKKDNNEVEDCDVIEKVLWHQPKDLAEDAHTDNKEAGPVLISQLFDAEPEWNEMEFLIKWKGQSHLHCQWKSLSDLQNLSGYKKVLNYTKKVTEEIRHNTTLSREEHRQDCDTKKPKVAFAVALILWLALGHNIKAIEALQDDRPHYHFEPSKYWMNGPVYYKGLYHLFYQYNPNGSYWADGIVWAHSVSKDLVNWMALEPAIYPSKWFDIKGTWSGSITIIPGKGPVIMYTGLNKNRTNMQNYAIPQDPSDPYLRKWIKPDDNPIIMPDFSMNGSSFRDPTTAWFSKDGHWRMLVGSKRKKRGMAYIYRSRDFKHWVKAKHPLHSKESTGMWECPDLFPVSTTDFRNGLDLDYDGPNIKHVFKVSLDVTRYDYYTLVKYDQADRYVSDGNSPDGWEGLRYDYGNFYASKTFFDYKKNRRILWGWVNESDIAPDDVRKGWAGIQAIPRTVLLDSSKKQLVFWPIEEIESLRCNFVRENNLQISTGQRVEIKGITPAQVDIDVTFNLGSLKNVDMYYPGLTKLEPIELCKVLGSNVIGSIGPFGLITLASPEMEEYTPVFFRVFKDTYNNMTKVLMCSDARRSSLKQDKGPLPHQMMYKPSFGGFVDIDLSDRRISLRTMIDHSVVESFGALGKTVITSRVYPVKNAHLYVFNNGTQTVNVESLNAWSMARPMRMNT